MRNFLVTGGAGYVGSHLVAALLDQGARVTVLDDLSTGHYGAVPLEAGFIQADLADNAAVDAVVARGYRSTSGDTNGNADADAIGGAPAAAPWDAVFISRPCPRWARACGCQCATCWRTPPTVSG